MDSKLIQRATRMGQSNPNRSRVGEFLRTEGKQIILRAAEQGNVPAAAVSQALLEAFGLPVMTAPLMRQFCGLTCAAILSEEGFVVEQTGVRVPNNPLFTFGATYRRVTSAQVKGQGTSLLERLINTLDADELRDAEDLIRARRHDIKSQLS